MMQLHRERGCEGAVNSTTVTTTQPIDFTLVLDVSGSMGDPMGKTDTTKRLYALKTAVDNFLDGAAAANEGSQSGSEPVRVGLVKFSGEESKYVGMTCTRVVDTGTTIPRS